VFDVAFSELVVIAVVALIVIGPEKLPRVARTLGFLVGRMQRYVSNVKADIEREMQFEDLQKLQQEIKDNVMAGKAQVVQATEQIARHSRQEVNTIEQIVTLAQTPNPSDNPSPVELDSTTAPATIIPSQLN
jgi:sec-independent protein translocase protein TatB